MTREYTILKERMATVGRRRIAVEIIVAALTGCVVSSFLALIFIFAESLFYLPPSIKTPLVLTIPVAGVVAFVTLVIMRLFVIRVSDDDLARMIQKSFPSLGDRLVSAIQLGRLDDDSLRGQSGDLVDALVAAVEKDTRGLDLNRSVSLSGLVFCGRLFSGIVMFGLLAALIFPESFSGGTYRLYDHRVRYVSPDTTFIHVLDSPESVLRGDDFIMQGLVDGVISPEITVFHRREGSNSWHGKPVTVSDGGFFSAVIEKPQRSFEYYLESDDVASRKYAVSVIKRPDVASISVSLTYPAYTGLGTVDVSDGDGSIRALAGTEVSLAVTADKPLSSMTIQWADSTSLPCELAGSTGTARFVVEGTTDYHIDLVDTLGIANIDPITYRVTSLVDEPPMVAILAPPSDVVMPLSLTFPMVYQASDDFGLTSVTLVYSLPFDNMEKEIDLKRGTLGHKTEDVWTWDLSRFGLLPDDAVTYYIRVVDNDSVTGPKNGVSETHTVRVPSVTDIYSEVNETNERTVDRLRDMTGRRLDDDALDDVRKNILEGDELDWTDRTALDEAAKNMESMQKDLRELSDDVRKTASTLSEEDMAAVETLEKYTQIADLMDQIAEGEMKEALRRLASPDLKLDPKKLKEAIEKHNVTAEDIKKKLDRTIELLEQVAALQQFETARRLLEEIAERQAEVSQSYPDTPKDEGLWREQSLLSSEMDRLEKDIGDILDELEERFDVDTSQTKSALDSLNVPQAMKNAAESMTKGEQREAERDLSESNARLSSLLESMDAMSKAMMDSNSEEIKKRLFTVLFNMLEVSAMQEEFLEKVARGNIPSTDDDNMASRQLEIVDAFSKARRSLDHFGEVVAEVAGVLDSMAEIISMTMKRAVDGYAAGKTDMGNREAGSALADLNRVIHVIASLSSSGEGQGQGMPGDLMQQLQKIANGQMSLQMQMGGGMSQEMMMKLAAEQQKLAQMLSELGSKAGEDPSLQKMLEGLAEDMDETARMMRRNEARRTVERRQTDIYRRLLDARRSRRKKDEQGERKSWTAKRDISRGANSLAGNLGERRRELNARMRQALNDDFEPEYLRLIKQYFESMLKDYEPLNTPAGQSGGAR